MMYRIRTLLYLLFAMPLCAFGQGYVYQTGSPTFSTQIPVEHGFINVNNGDLHLDIPVASLLQHGGVLAANAHLVYDSRIWKIVEDAGGNYSWQPTNVPNSLGGWTILTGTETGSSITSIPTGRSNIYEGGTDNFGHLQYCYHLTQSYNKFTWTDPVGTSHVFNGGWIQENYPCNYPSGTPIEDTQESGGGYATDGSGLILSMSGYRGNSPDQLAYTVKDRSGTQLYPSVIDRNGNGITSSATRTQTGNQIDIAVPAANSTGTAHYIITTEQINFRTLFLQSGVGETSGSLTVVQSIQLPDGSQYQFGYDSINGRLSNYGGLNSITLPTGGIIKYGYTGFKDSFQNLNTWIGSRTANGGTETFTPKTISACSSSQGCQEQVTVNTPDPKSSTGNDAVYTFTLDAGQIANGGSFATNIAAYQGSASGGKPLRTESTNYTYKTIQDTTLYTAEQVQVTTTKDMLPDAGVVTQTQNTYDIYTDLLTDTKAWNYQAGSFAAQPDRDTAYTYQQNTGGIPTGLVTKTLVTDGAGNPLSSVKYDYDTRGNPTGQHQWINTTNTTFDTGVSYKGTGALLSSTAPEGKTTYAYDPTDTFVTGTTAPTPSSGAVLTAGTAYNASTGAVTSATDPNGNAVSYASFDAFNRAGQINYPDGGVTTVSYPDSVTVNESTAFNSTGNGTTMQQNDAYGRPSRIAVATGQANTYYQQDTCYDVSGRANFQSYRYQGSGFSGAKVCTGAGDSYTYDALGRTTQVTHGDGTSLSYSYAGRAVKTTDENGVSKISQSDAFGRITSACEVSSDATMPNSGSPAACGTDIAGTGFVTSYSYNPAAFQTTVTQGAQTRVFTTDSLGRQVSVQEPESGTTTYGYAYNSTRSAGNPHQAQSQPDQLGCNDCDHDAVRCAGPAGIGHVQRRHGR